jgi:A118 family predicted phage portal protein
MFENLKQLILRLFRIEVAKTDEEENSHREDVKAYDRTTGINMTAIIANRLATLTVTESKANITGDNQRAEFINSCFSSIWKDAQEITARSFGAGGVALVPYVAGNKIYTSIVPKDRFFVTRAQGTDIIGATIAADVKKKKTDTYIRFTDYELQNGSYVIRNRATRNGSTCSLAEVAEWSGIAEEIRIGNVDRLLLTYLKSPYNRGEIGDLYGVPITKGSEDIIQQIEDCLKQIQLEFRNKEARVFADEMLFDKDDKVSAKLFKKVHAPGGISGSNASGAFFEIFDPAFRDTSYYNRLNELFILLEKSVGTSRGLLTEPVTVGATATEIKRSSYDTYALITAMRNQWQDAVDALAYAYNVLANAFNLSSAGDYAIEWDWSTSLIESSAEMWNQMLQAKSAGAVKTAEVRQYIYPEETMEEAQAAVEEIAANEPSLSSLIGE